MPTFRSRHTQEVFSSHGSQEGFSDVRTYLDKATTTSSLGDLLDALKGRQLQMLYIFDHCAR